MLGQTCAAVRLARNEKRTEDLYLFFFVVLFNWNDDGQLRAVPTRVSEPAGA